ncbi:HNH endonuclease [Rheinheimera sp. 1928-s]|uniref:HNH endonuclease n=1 Tax=Rheinheimera sp. 1928-s TaxID=3033803 RepID=UPI00260FACAA|nr:HNH endonuclease [Rheinheimera sp. 1928-s]MDF3126422.1 HNH endonuclease [Rheinheimera sp. 1928-s]
MSKYIPLAEYLASQTSDFTQFTFPQIEELLGFNLPNSARLHSAWWANSRTNDSHTWAHLWINSGWEVDSLDINTERVTFRRFEIFEINSDAAIEGYDRDRKILVKHRNSELAKQRKERDNYSCAACGFYLNIEGKWVIEVHHLNPLSITGEVVTSIDDLVCLCPTCHRIAHTKNPPFNVAEINQLLPKKNSGNRS